MIRRITKRIVITLLIVAVVAVIAGGVAVVSWIANSGRQSPLITAKIQEGGTFGKTTDQKGCMTEGLRRAATIGLLELQKQADNENFVLGCLQTSMPSPGFCEGVPSGAKNIFADWDKKQCEKVNLPSPICTGIYNQQIRFCER
jgi:hypothetical protein